MNIPYSWLFLSTLVTMLISIQCSRRYPSFNRRFYILVPVLLCCSSVATIVFYRSLAHEASSDISPDGRFKVVFYRLPYFSGTPGSGSDCPAIVRLFDNKGNHLASADLPMIQMAQVTWFPDNLEVGYLQFDLPPPSV